MRKHIFACLYLLGTSTIVFAQLPEDALRYGYPLSGGTARNQALGGAGASLGGDISSAHINPAGIGLYRTKEFVLSPGINFMNNKYDYLGSDTKQGKNAFNYGTSGFVFGHSNNGYRKATSSAVSISINQLANYNNHIEYRGLNTQSSWSEQYLEQAVNNLGGLSKEEIVAALENDYPFGTSLAYWTFLMDTATVNGSFMPISNVPIAGLNPGNYSGGVYQHNIIDTKGGAHEIALTFANSYNDKLHLGVSFNVPVYSYTKDQVYREEDATNDANNNFSYFEYREHYRTSGFGFNAKLGLIWRPVQKLRLGLAFHTPTFANLTDNINASMTTNTEGYTVYPQPLSQNSGEILSNNNRVGGEYEYSLTTPLRAIISGSYVINEVGDVQQQKGFITADLEMVNYGGVRYSANNGNSEDANYYHELNDVIRSRYKTALNVRVGGEMKFNTLMGRLGFAYMGSPYKSEELKGSRMLLSGGLGYRNRGYFVDLTYQHAFINNSQVPYYLQDKASPVADGKDNRGALLLTFGVKI